MREDVSKTSCASVFRREGEKVHCGWADWGMQNKKRTVMLNETDLEIQRAAP
jgi:hypothetical protein